MIKTMLVYLLILLFVQMFVPADLIIMIAESIAEGIGK
jgi:hypothetical protein